MECIRKVRHNVKSVGFLLKMGENRLSPKAKFTKATYCPRQEVATFYYRDGVDEFELRLHWSELQDAIGVFDKQPDENVVGIRIEMPEIVKVPEERRRLVEDHLEIDYVVIKLSEGVVS